MSPFLKNCHASRFRTSLKAPALISSNFSITNTTITDEALITLTDQLRQPSLRLMWLIALRIQGLC